MCVYGVVQSLAMAAVFAYALVTLYQAGIPRWAITVVFGMYALLTYNVAYSATMWKDIPFSIAALALVVSLYRILRGIGKNGALNYVNFALGGIFFCLMRTNGWYSCLVTALVLIPMVRKRKLTVLLCGILAAGWICNGPVLDALGVSETNFVEALAIPFQQVSRVVADGREIPEQDREMLEEIFDLEKVRELYDPLIVDPIKFEAFRHDKRDYLRENLGDYGRLWLRLGMKYPWEYTKAWIDQTQGYWNAGYFYTIYPDLEEDAQLGEAFGIRRPDRDNPVKDGFEKIFAVQRKIPFLAQPLLGIGFHVWILILCFVVNLVKKREEFLLTIPILVIVAGLWIGTPVFSEFRYAYPVFVSVPVLLCVTAFETKKV